MTCKCLAIVLMCGDINCLCYRSRNNSWGNTVNVASRMESTGKAGCIQVVEETAHILEEFGFIFEQRGLVSVKGKGKLMTYYLVGKK